jgi:hypothetical protein
MDFSSTLRQLVGLPHLAALRPRGPVVFINDRNRVVDIRGRRARPYVGKLSDYLALDWQIVTADQLGKLLAARAQAQAQPSTDNDGDNDHE